MVAGSPGHGLTGEPLGGMELPQVLELQVLERLRHGLTMMLQTPQVRTDYSCTLAHQDYLMGGPQCVLAD